MLLPYFHILLCFLLKISNNITMDLFQIRICKKLDRPFFFHNGFLKNQANIFFSFSSIANPLWCAGVVIYPTNSGDTDDYGYQLVKGNVDLLKLIQLGITLFDDTGRLPKGVCTWQVRAHTCTCTSLS